MKGNKGITLIALVITIIVLLILAGVSIAMLSGDNSILKQAQNARDNSAAGTLDETVKIAVANIMTANLGWPEGGATVSGTKTPDVDNKPVPNKDLIYEIKQINPSLTDAAGTTPGEGKKVSTITATINNQTQTVYVDVTTGAIVSAAD